MMFKKTIFVTVLSLLTVGSFKPAEAQNRAPLLGGFLAAACGAGAYNHATNDRGWATAGAALLCGVIGYAIGNEMDKNEAGSLNGCLNSGEATCKFTKESGEVVEFKRTLIEQKTCYKTAPFQTPWGIKDCVCYIDEKWVTVRTNGSYSEHSQREDAISNLERRSRELDERWARIERSRNGNMRTSGGSSDYQLGGSVVTDRDEEMIYNRYSRNLVNNSRSGNNRESVEAVDQRYVVNGCIVTQEFIDAAFGFTDDVCRQYISNNSFQEAKSMCTGKDENGQWSNIFRSKASATPNSCRSKN